MSALSKAVAVALVALMLVYSPAVIDGAKAGLVNFALSALPTLLPFFVAARLFVKSGAARMIASPLSGLWRALGLNDEAGGVCLASLVSGYPTGANLTALLHKDGKITLRQAETLSVLASNPGPLFVVGAVGGILGSQALAWLILGSCAAGALGSAALTRQSDPAHGQSVPSSASEKRGESFPALLTDALAQSCVSLMPVGGVMAFWGAVIRVLRQSGALSLVAYPSTGYAAIASALEMVTGCTETAAIPDGLFIRALVCCFALSFGGLSVVTQSLAFLLPTGVSASGFVQRKLLSSGIAMTVFAAGYRLLPLPPGIHGEAGAHPAVLPGLAALAAGVYFLYIPWSSWRLRRT